MMKLALGLFAIISITIIGASAIEARKAHEKCNRYLRDIRERSRQ